MINKFIFSEIIITAMLVGLIWTIQILNYPMFNLVNASDFHTYHQYHINSITLLVGPLMLIELALCLSNNYSRLNSDTSSLFISLVLLGLLLLIWGTTYFISVPIHNLLTANKDENLIQKLITTNWIRTTAWTLRLIILVNLNKKLVS